MRHHVFYRWNTFQKRKNRSQVFVGQVAVHLPWHRRQKRARAIQTERYKAKGNGIRTNAEADGELLEQVAPLDEPSRKLITQAIERFRLSARGFHRVLRVARTLADLEGGGAVKQIHVAEALTHRRVLPGR